MAPAGIRAATPVIVLGAGGNCRDIVDAMLDANRASSTPVFEPLGYLDDDPAKLGSLVVWLGAWAFWQWRAFQLARLAPRWKRSDDDDH